MLSRIKRKIFYGWVIVAVSIVVTTVLSSSRFSFGVFLESLESEFELTRAATSSMFSVYMVFSVIFTVLGGWALDKYGPRKVILVMGLFSGSSLVLTGFTDSLWQLYFTYSFLLAIGTAAIYTMIMATVSRWFHRRRGFALGIAGSGVGLGNVIIAPFATLLISNFGWRMAYIIMGIITFLIVVPTSRLQRDNPSDIGEMPDGKKPKTDKTELKNIEVSLELAGFTLLQALRTRNFWFMVIIMLFSSFSNMLILTHIVPNATDMRISSMEAATIISIMGGFQIISRLVMGRVSDITGGKAPGVISALLRVGALVGLIWARELWMFYLFAAVYGFSWGGMSIALMIQSVEAFGKSHIGAILGTMSAGFAVGAAIGPLVGGLVYDVNGNYTLAFLIGAALMLVATLLITLIRHGKFVD